MNSTPDFTLVSSNCKPEYKNSAMFKSKRPKFCDSYFRQNFSLPSDSFMFYIVKNPTSPELYKKIIKTCKYFFIKNRILVITEFSNFGGDKWHFSLEKRQFDISVITFKLWVTNQLSVYSFNIKDVNQNILSSVMPKLYQCDAKTVIIDNQIISFHDLPFLISSADDISFINFIVKDKNGINVAVEKIVETAVKAKKIYIQSSKSNLKFTSETMKKLIKLPHFSNLDELTLHGIPEVFDLETFSIYMKKNKTTKFWLWFGDSISEVYKNRLEKVIDEILATEIFDYKPPFINFNGLVWEKYDKLRTVYFSQKF